MDLTKLVSLGLAASVFGFVIWLVRERRLREKYALLWLSTSVIVVLLTVSRSVLEKVALSIGIYYPPSLLFLVGVLFLMLVSIGHSVTLSRLSDSNHQLAQEVALLRKQLEDEKEKGKGEGLTAKGEELKARGEELKARGVSRG